MRKRSISLPLVVLIAVAALVLGSFGSATAAGLTSKQVKKIAAKVVKKKAKTLTVATAKTALSVPDNTINSADIADGSVTAADLAAGVLPARLFGQVNPDGTKQFGTITSVRTGIGRYDVTFPQNVATCAVVATALGANQTDIDIVMVTAGNVVTVDTENPDGGNVNADFAFNILAAC